MALVTVGNTRIGDSWNVRYQNYYITCEYNASSSFIYYKLIATERSYEKKIRIAFYVRYPSSSQYAYLFGYYPKELIPAVFRAENGKVVEVLSEGHLTFPIKNINGDWQIYEVYLKRDFEQGEEIWAGVWGETLTPIWDSKVVTKGTAGENFLYLFGLHGRRNDYAPYFDNGEALNSDQGRVETLGMIGMLGNYSLYWQYYNEPIPNDCNIIVGNPRMGNKCREIYEIEREDDEGETYDEEIEMESSIGSLFTGYFYQLQHATANNQIKFHVYQQLPVLEDYLEIMGLIDISFCPVVYKCDSNSNFTELMNSEVALIVRDEDFIGWIDVTIPLKRNLSVGEYIFVGCYAFDMNPVWVENDSRITGQPIMRRYYTPGYNERYITGAIQDSSILSRSTQEIEPEKYSMYFEYYAILRTDYVRSVVSAGNVVSVAFKSAGLKTLLQEIKNIRDSSERKLALFRLFSDVKKFQDIEERKTDAKRNLLANGNLDDGVLRSSELKRNNSESFGLRDFVNRTIGLFARVFTKLDASDDVYRRLKIKRSESSVNVLITRLNAGRLIFRTVATVFGLWDWLKGKIRNENCIVELFTPITDVLEIECRI